MQYPIFKLFFNLKFKIHTDNLFFPFSKRHRLIPQKMDECQ